MFVIIVIYIKKSLYRLKEFIKPHANSVGKKYQYEINKHQMSPAVISMVPPIATIVYDSRRNRLALSVQRRMSLRGTKRGV